jgi:hypothetical protein
MGDPLTVARVRNPDASADLELVISLECNTSSEAINDNIRANAADEDLPWLTLSPAHDGVAVIVGGGPSAADCVEDINDLGGYIIALNGASNWLRKNGIIPDCQCIIDARPENISLLDRKAPLHLFASQVDPGLMCVRPTLMHLMSEGILDLLPEERKKAGGYALLGGGYGVGNTAICAAYTMGYRTLHCLGFDSSHRNGKGHAYSQPMNDGDILVDTEWDGVTYTSSLSMKAHAERFQILASDLEHIGCKVHVHGDGLLPAMWRVRDKQLSEGSKYRLLWSTAAYRQFSPGEQLVERFCDLTPANSTVIDFGCGTGRAGMALSKKGHDVTLVDFAENCRDPGSMKLPFEECDLTKPIPLRADYGFCTDVMEHIPPKEVELVIRNIMECVQGALFQISTVPDSMGGLIGKPLHLTVRDHQWWRQTFQSLGYLITWQEMRDDASCFFVKKETV